MASSPSLQRLCCQLVEDYYGDFHRTLYETLLDGGRLSATQIAQKCHLPLKQVRQGLAALIQGRLVHHHSLHEVAAAYSADLKATYDLIRIGPLIHLTLDQYDELATEIMRIACSRRFFTFEELACRVAKQDKDSSYKQITQKTQALIDDGFFTYVRTSHFSSEHDVRRDAERVIGGGSSVNQLASAAARQKFNLEVDNLVARQVDTNQHEEGYVNEHYPDDTLDSNGARVNGHTKSKGQSASPANLLQPNFQKVASKAAAASMTSKAMKLHGTLAATVLSSALDQTLRKDAWTILDTEEQSLHMNQLVDDVNSARRKNNLDEYVNGIGHKDEMEDLVREDLDKPLHALSEGQFKFIISYGQGNWAIQTSDMLKHIRTQELLRIMDSRLDPPAPRLVRILIDRGRLEEKTLQEIGLLGAKELRQSLALLKTMGFADLQEVPRNLQRQPNQTVFLWFHDQSRVITLILEGIYVAVTRMLQLLNLERVKLAGTMAKIERDDVRGREEEMLGSQEWKVLSRFRKLEGWIWAEINRLDQSVAILRDM